VAEAAYAFGQRNADCELGGISMSQPVPPPVAPADDALSGAPEPWERWETTLVLGSIAVGVVGLVVLGWLVDRFILP
jgi:hypothetical protein